MDFSDQKILNLIEKYQEKKLEKILSKYKTNDERMQRVESEYKKALSLKEKDASAYLALFASPIILGCAYDFIKGTQTGLIYGGIGMGLSGIILITKFQYDEKKLELLSLKLGK